MEYDTLYKEVLGRLDAYKDNEKKIKTQMSIKKLLIRCYISMRLISRQKNYLMSSRKVFSC